MASKKSTVLELVEGFTADLQKAKASPIAQAVRVVAETKGARTLELDLTASSSALTRFKLDIDGYWVAVTRGASAGMAIAMDLGAGGLYGPVYPGVTIRPKQKFTSISFWRWASSTLPRVGAMTNAGVQAPGRYLTIVVGKTPEAEWVDPDGAASGFMQQRFCTGLPGGLLTYNSLLNVPSSVNDGVAIDNALAVRAAVSDVTNVLGGTIVWWWMDPSGNWYQTDVSQPLPTGTAFSSPGEVEVQHKAGRLFAELRSYTNAGGVITSTTLAINVFTTSGELRANEAGT